MHLEKYSTMRKMSTWIKTIYADIMVFISAQKAPEQYFINIIELDLVKLN